MRLIRAGLVAVVALAIAGCEPSGPTSPLPSARLANGWHFVQWEGFSASLEGESAPVVLSFVSVGGNPPETIGSVTLISNRGDIPTTIQALTPSPKSDLYQLFSLSLVADRLATGSYRFAKVRVRTESTETTYEVGSWELDVAPRPLDTVLRVESSTVGGTELSAIEVALTNTGSDAITIEGLEARLPRRGVTFAASTGQPTGGSPVPVLVAQGSTATVIFVPIAESESPGFVFVKPLLRYRVGNRPNLRLFALDAQIFAPPFATDESLGLYLRTLPKAASGN